VVVQACPVTLSTVVVAVDVGKNEFAFSVTDVARQQLLKTRTGCPMTASSVRQVSSDIQRVLPAEAVVKVGIEADAPAAENMFPKLLDVPISAGPSSVGLGARVPSAGFVVAARRSACAAHLRRIAAGGP